MITERIYRIRLLTACLVTLSFLPSIAFAVAGLEPPRLRVSDTPDDWGVSLTLRWTPVIPEGSQGSYRIWRLEAGKGRVPSSADYADTAGVGAALEAAGWKEIAEKSATDTVFADSDLSRRTRYSYIVVAETGGGLVPSAASEPQAPRVQYIRYQTTNILIAVALFMAVVVLLVERARRGAHMFIRRIAGLEAVEEAVGRATEMGRPILYIPGLDPMDEVATVAAIDILGQVAKKAGEYETKLVVPNRDPIVMAVAQQVVRESYSEVGKPYLYQEDNVFYVTYSQFGFAAAVAGLMVRERPATNFFIGHFYAESLVLAETGNATGAIQIAGTDADAQLPFFISACDYTLIGEELYAGSVYLSRQPLLLGALKSQDYAKAVIIAVLIVGVVLSLFNPDVAAHFKALFR